MGIGSKIKFFQSRMKTNSTLKYKVFLSFLTVFILFFGTSKLWLPSDAKVMNTSIGTEPSTSTNTSIILRSWQYNRTKNYMEISFDVHNNEDNQNLVFTPKAHTNTNKAVPLNISTALNKGGYLVLQIKDVPKNWDTISLWVSDNQTDKQSNNSNGANFFCDIRKVKMNGSLQPAAKLNYEIQSVLNEIADVQKQIKSAQSEIQNANINISQLQFDIQTLKDNQKYQTKDEVEKSNSVISSKNSEIDTCKESITKFNNQIAEYNVKLQKLNQKLSDTKSGKVQSESAPSAPASSQIDSESSSNISVD